MTEDYCKPFDACKDLDGRLLINQTLEGPSLAIEAAEVPLGSMVARGSALRPYARVSYEQVWKAGAACTGPVRSIVGLAPAETMTIDVRQVEQVDFTRTVQNAVESSEVETHSRNQVRELVDNSWDGNTVDLSTIVVGEWGSLFEVIGAVAGAVFGGPIGAGVGAWLGGMVDDHLGGDSSGGGGTGNDRILSVVDETLDSVTRSHSQRTVTETTTSRSSLTERNVSRTFINPYRDRSLQLRFTPVFREFEVTTTLYRLVPGIVFELGDVRFLPRQLSAKLGDFIQKRVSDPRIASVAGADLGLDADVRERKGTDALGAHLNANSDFYAKRYLLHLQAQRDVSTLQSVVQAVISRRSPGKTDARALSKALAWSRVRVQDKGIFVPLSDPDTARKALALPKAKDDALRGALARVAIPLLRKYTRTRRVHLFMGTHIEAVPGNCLLPDVPPVP